MTIFMQKILRSLITFSQDIDDQRIVQSDWEKHILLYNLTLMVFNWEKTLLFNSKSNNYFHFHSLFSNSLNYFHSELLSIWPYAPDQPKAHSASLWKLGCGWPCLTTPTQMYDHQSFPSLVTASVQKILDIDWIPSKMLMIKQSFNMIRQKFILVY